MRKTLSLAALLALPFACQPLPEQGQTAVTLLVEPEAAVSTSALGWAVELTAARVMIDGVLLRAPAQTASVMDRISSFVIPSAHAHPGHGEAGVIVGELLERRSLDFVAPGTIGDATSLVVSLTAVDLSLTRADVGDGLDEGDPLVGHTAHLEGVARRGERSVAFTAIIDVEDGVIVEGVPLDDDSLALSEARPATIAVGLAPAAHIFDEVDFDSLPVAGGRAQIAPGSPDHNRVRRVLTSHDGFTAKERS